LLPADLTAKYRAAMASGRHGPRPKFRDISTVKLRNVPAVSLAAVYRSGKQISSGSAVKKVKQSRGLQRFQGPVE
jgi:hypothetical protein